MSFAQLYCDPDFEEIFWLFKNIAKLKINPVEFGNLKQLKNFNQESQAFFKILLLFILISNCKSIYFQRNSF